MKQVFVVPVADQEFGERPVALVAFSEPFTIQAVNLLQSFAMQRLEKFKQPIAYFSLEDEIGQSNGIKMSRTQLKAYIANKLREKNV